MNKRAGDSALFGWPPPKSQGGPSAEGEKSESGGTQRARGELLVNQVGVGTGFANTDGIELVHDRDQEALGQFEQGTGGAGWGHTPRGCEQDKKNGTKCTEGDTGCGSWKEAFQIFVTKL